MDRTILSRSVADIWPAASTSAALGPLGVAPGAGLEAPGEVAGGIDVIGRDDDLGAPKPLVNASATARADGFTVAGSMPSSLAAMDIFWLMVSSQGASAGDSWIRSVQVCRAPLMLPVWACSRPR